MLFAHAARRLKVLDWIALGLLASGLVCAASGLLPRSEAEDTVALTPVMLATAARAGIATTPLAMTIVWPANIASLLLPVSNLTNLLAAQRVGLPVLAFAERMMAPVSRRSNWRAHRRAPGLSNPVDAPAWHGAWLGNMRMKDCAP